MTKLNAIEQLTLLAHLAQLDDDVLSEVEIKYEFTGDSLHEDDLMMLQVIEKGIAAGLFYQPRPGVVKFVKSGIADFKSLFADKCDAH
jgi:hypothetical protein